MTKKKNQNVIEQNQKEIDDVYYADNNDREETKNEKKEFYNSKKYFGFSTRLNALILIFVFSAVLGLILFTHSFTSNKEKRVNYKESSNLDYKVRLLPNQFYEQEYLGKDMLYIASLIDKVEIDFSYLFNSDSNIDMDFEYNILADLVISNKGGTKTYFKKEYVLLEDQKLSMQNNSVQEIKENIKIDYSHYNTLANNFKSSYGVETESRLDVYLTVNKKNPDYNLNEKNKMNIIIPLSEKSVDIQLKYNEINNSNSVLKNSEFFVSSYFSFIISVLLLIVAILSLIDIIRKLNLLRTKQSNYDKQVNKILKEYDRLIAESTTLIPFDGKNIIKVKSFTELLDIHDNLQLPIIYYTITKHHKCYFYINHDDTVYLFVLKAIDLEVSKNEKKR